MSRKEANTRLDNQFSRRMERVRGAGGRAVKTTGRRSGAGQAGRGGRGIVFVKITKPKERSNAIKIAEISNVPRRRSASTSQNQSCSRPTRSLNELRPRVSSKRPDTVGEFAGLVEISTYAGKSACSVASIRAETGSLSFLAQP